MSNIVRNNRRPVGIHLIVNLYDIRNEDSLKYIWKGKIIGNNIIEQLNLHIVGETGYQFDPHGYTIAYALSESHFTIHTYPEHRAAYLDIFCCNPNFNPQIAIRVLKDAFETETATHHIIRR